MAAAASYVEVGGAKFTAAPAMGGGRLRRIQAQRRINATKRRMGAKIKLGVVRRKHPPSMCLSKASPTKALSRTPANSARATTRQLTDKSTGGESADGLAWKSSRPSRRATPASGTGWIGI